jgi:hypothetical protein
VTASRITSLSATGRKTDNVRRIYYGSVEPFRAVGGRNWQTRPVAALHDVPRVLQCHQLKACGKEFPLPLAGLPLRFKFWRQYCPARAAQMSRGLVSPCITAMVCP